MAPINAAPTQPNMLSRKYITGAAAQPSEPPTPWMLKARPSRPGFTEALSSAKSAGWKTELPSARDHRDGGEAHEGMRHRYQRQGNADGEQPAGQDRPRAEAVDGEARHGLGDARDAVEDAGQQADLGEAQARLLAHDQQHRGEGELIVVAGAVGGADQADDADVAGRGNGNCGHGGG